MPFTPFHLGPGYLAAAATAGRPRWFSFYVFSLSQLVIDLETLRNILAGEPRLHTFFHTFAGSLAAGALTVLLYRPLYHALDAPLRLFPGFKMHLATFRVWERETPPWGTAAISALLGAWSHVALDALNHADVRPFWPWSEANPVNGLLGNGELYLGCLVAGISGYGLLAWLRKRA